MLLHTPVICLRRHVTYDNHTQQVLADFPLLPLNLTEMLHLKKTEQETTQQRLKTEYAIYAHMQVKKQPLYAIKIIHVFSDVTCVAAICCVFCLFF